MRSIALILALAALPASANAQASYGADQLMRADADGDGQVARAEFVAWRAGQFDRLDRNKDGFISEADRGRGGPIRAFPVDPAEIAARFDADQDGKVSRAEFSNGPTPAFDRADADGDGLVTRAELQSARPAR